MAIQFIKKRFRKRPEYVAPYVVQKEVESIVEPKEEIKEVKGTPCEVFSRVCGYLRPVQNRNHGKKEEFFLRKPYNIENPNSSIVKR